MVNKSYVRTEMLSEREAPRSQQGIVKWMLENLFSSIPNAIMTILALWVAYSVLSGVLPWVFQSSWSAGSLKECRADIHAVYGEGVAGACWAVIRERWPQLLFGFYPKDLYWRPVAALVLLFVALSPILFAGIPRKLMLFSMIYPFVGFWLLWGGTVWVPLAALAGFVFGYLAIQILPKSIGSLGATIAAGVLPILWWVFLAGPTIDVLNTVSANALHERYMANQEQLIETYEAEISSGELTESEVKPKETSLKEATRRLASAIGMPERESEVEALEIAADNLRDGLPSSVSDVFSLDDLGDDVSDGDLGALKETLAAEADLSAAEQRLKGLYKEVGRIGPVSIDSDQMGGFMLSIIIGVTGIALSLPIGILLALGRQSPLFVVKTICVTFIEFIRGVPLITLLFVASVLLNYFLPPGTNFDLVLRVMIMVTIFAAAYMAEVIRGGLAALPKGQYEAADALGLDYWKATRLIIMPQALKISIPNIVSNFIGLFKDTTLVSIVGLMDPMGFSQAIRADQNWNGIVWELYAFIAVMFWIFTFSMSRYSMYLERKLKTSH